MCRTERLTVLALTTARRYGIVTIKAQHINTCRPGSAENASTGKRKYGKGKYETAHFARMENACTETQVRICRDGKRKYGKCKYNANLQSDKKSLVLHKLVWCIFKWGAQVDYRLFFF